jgi:hypothetical protein
MGSVLNDLFPPIPYRTWVGKGGGGLSEMGCDMPDLSLSITWVGEGAGAHKCDNALKGTVKPNTGV